jgi:hypothetical protein
VLSDFAESAIAYIDHAAQAPKPRRH